jgi:hypothetical protein
VTLAYLVIAIVMTWPMLPHLASRIAADLGDPPFSAWTLEWTSGQVLSALSGHPSALASYFDGNIFYPAPLTIAFSEHLTPQMLQALPIYAGTHNIILCYNLLFLSTFVVGGLGMYLFVRDVTGEQLAAFLAGLAFVYAPYRLGQFSHIQVMSTEWMPLTLYGFRRYFDTRSMRALAGGAAALLLQGLSNGYFLLFFPPFAAAYCVYEMTRRRLLADWKTWRAMSIAAAAVGVFTLPFVWPYATLQASGAVAPRSLDEIAGYAADTHAFALPPPTSVLWSHVPTTFVKPENTGFPGLTILAFVCVALAAAIWRWLKDPSWRTAPIAIRAIAGVVTAIFIGYAGAVALLFVDGRLTIGVGASHTILRNVNAPLVIATLSLVALIALTMLVRTNEAPASSRTPGPRTSNPRTPIAFCLVAALAAALLALGPRIESLGHRIGTGPYLWLLEYVPGFNGLRVPARYLTVVTLFLAAAAGLGASVVLTLRRRALAKGLVVAGMVGILAEAWFVPMLMNVPVTSDRYLVPQSLRTGAAVSALYSTVKDAPPGSVLIEFPFGEEAYDVQAVFYAGVHRRPLVNGYSGYFPHGYFERADRLRDFVRNPQIAADALRSSGATMAIVHQGAYQDATGQALCDWLISNGAHEIGRDGLDRLFVLAK